MHNGIKYLWVKDIYSPYGIIFKEARDPSSTWVTDPILIRELIDIYRAKFDELTIYPDVADDPQLEYQDTLKLAGLIR